MAKTLADIEAALARFLFDRWLEKTGATPELWASFARGIPEEWARAIEDVTDGLIRVSDWPHVIHSPKVLQNRLHRASVNGNDMQASHRIAISEGTKADPFLEMIRNAKPRGFTQNSLAKRLGISPTLLSLYRKGSRPISRSRAKRIEALTGWPADDAHWRGIVEND